MSPRYWQHPEVLRSDMAPPRRSIDSVQRPCLPSSIGWSSSGIAAARSGHKRRINDVRDGDRFPRKRPWPTKTSNVHAVALSGRYGDCWNTIEFCTAVVRNPAGHISKPNSMRKGGSRCSVVRVETLNSAGPTERGPDQLRDGDAYGVQQVKEDKNRPRQKIGPKPEDLPVFVQLETTDQLRALLKKMYPSLTDEELDLFM
jgi:hypothetical protein